MAAVAAQYQVNGSNAAEISASIEAGIRGGHFLFGTSLPAVRILAGDLHVSPATVARAYQDLRQRGVVESEGRKGTRVRSRPALALLRSDLRPSIPPGMRDLSSGEPDLRLLPRLGPALRAVADRGEPPRGYAPESVLPELAAAARSRLRAEGIPVDGAAITVTAGALDAIERLLLAHLRPGDAVAIEDPGWANLIDLLAALGLRPVPVAVDEQGIDPAALAGALRAGARAVVVTVRAQNPTGAATGADRAVQLRELLTGHPGVLVVEDDHAAELADREPHCIGPVTSSWAFVRSASKPFGPDLRICVVAGDETTVARVAGRMRLGMGWVPALSQQILLHLWQDPEVTALVAGAARAYAQSRTALRDALLAAGVPARGETGINVWIPVPDETRVVSALRDEGIAVAPGSLFRIGSGPGIRITVSTLAEAEIPVVVAAVEAAIRPRGVVSPMR
ncbi:GntR family transcriptional regulator [Actinoplanes sp. NBRC 101535]|nr:GntR family transcriptional regulator [Actinoplanes sp. NBRC 101535]